MNREYGSKFEVKLASKGEKEILQQLKKEAEVDVFRVLLNAEYLYVRRLMIPPSLF